LFVDERGVGSDLAQGQVAGGVLGLGDGQFELVAGLGEGVGSGGVDVGATGGAGLAGAIGGVVDRGGQGRLGGAQRGAGGLDGGAGVFVGWVGHQPVRVISESGVAVQGVEGDVFAGVFEVVLLAPSPAQPPAHLGGGQVGV